MIDAPFEDALSTSADSPDTLPVTGYTVAQLRDYIARQLGAPTWNVELSPQQILDCVQDALGKFSLWRPMCHWGAVALANERKQYLLGADVGQGVAEVTFVENRLGVLSVDMGNPFITAATVTNALGLDGMGDYDTFQRWQQTWLRVTSTMPRWEWDESRKCLWIHNPISRYKASVLCYRDWKGTEKLNRFGADWVKEYALAKSRYLLGDIWMKFSGAIPGPASNMQLDGGKRDKAEAKIKELEDLLKASQLSQPMSFD